MDLIRQSDAAKFLGISKQLFWNYIKARKITPTMILGEGANKARLFTESQLIEFQKNRKPKGRPLGTTGRKWKREGKNGLSKN